LPALLAFAGGWRLALALPALVARLCARAAAGRRIHHPLGALRAPFSARRNLLFTWMPQP